MTRDDLNSNYDIIYDHRNLILELKKLVIDINGSRNDTTIYHTLYYYDEAGNRIRKMIYNNSNDSLLSDNIYSRDVSGRELAIYENGSIDQWNIYGMDNIGFIDGNEDIRFYMKDHLGSIRAVTDVSGNVVSSQDYDAWGYLLENRVYDSDVSVYKFTSKERDDESKYDYFGARYYDARVGRWGSIDPLLEKHFDFTPYNYALNNSLFYIDPDGKQVSKLILDIVKNIFLKPDKNEEGGFGNKDEDLDNDGQRDNIDSKDGRSEEQKLRDDIYKNSKERKKEEINSIDEKDKINDNSELQSKESKEEKLQRQFLVMIKELNIQKKFIEGAENIEIERSKIGIKSEK
jgi:RHS repeat-associated protein